jgi:predicted nucleic acid-binding protein
VRDFRLKLSAADALHLATAIVERITLVTFDRRLAEASMVLNTPVIVPGR